MPALIDAKEGAVVYPVEPATHRSFLLCKDEKALELAGLPRMHRRCTVFVVWARTGSAGIRTYSGAPCPPVRPTTDIFKEFYLFNPGEVIAGAAVTPSRADGFADILSGETWSGFQCSKEAIRLGAPMRNLKRRRSLSRGHLFVGIRQAGDCWRFSI
jgi:hypothetical protein